MKRLLFCVLISASSLTAINMKADKVGVHDNRIMIQGIPTWEWDGPQYVGVSGTLYCPNVGLCYYSYSDGSIDVNGWGRFDVVGMAVSQLEGSLVGFDKESNEIYQTDESVYCRQE